MTGSTNLSGDALEIRALGVNEIDSVSGGSLLGTMLKPSMSYLAGLKIKNTIKVIEEASKQIQDAIK